MDIKDLARAAGLLEGEGSFTGSGKSIQVSAGQKTIEPLMWLVSLFGGTIDKAKKDGFFQWHVSGALAAGVALTVFSFMSERRKQQIERSIERWKTANRPNIGFNKHFDKLRAKKIKFPLGYEPQLGKGEINGSRDFDVVTGPSHYNTEGRCPHGEHPTLCDECNW